MAAHPIQVDVLDADENQDRRPEFPDETPYFDMNSEIFKQKKQSQTQYNESPNQ
jgi:hypothetical protein